MWDGFDKRKFPRINLRCELILRNAPEGETIRTQTENVGAGGVCVLLDRALERFSVHFVRLELDPNLPWIECLGKVVWIVPCRDLGKRQERFDTGVEFVDLEPGSQELIRCYVDARVVAEEPKS